MAKGMRTQPTSRDSIPTSQNLDFGFVFVCVFQKFWNPKSCFSNSTWKMFNGSRLYRRGLKISCVKHENYNNRYMDRKLKKYEFKHWLTTKSWIWGLWVFSDWVAKRFPVPSTRNQVGLLRCTGNFSVG